MKLLKENVSFDFVYDATEHPVVTVRIETQAGSISIMAEPEFVFDSLYLRRFHIQGDDVSINGFGARKLRDLAVIAMEEMACDELIIEGAVRTTGAGRGRQPQPVRFIRRVVAEP